MIGAIALTLIYALNLLWWIIVVSAIMSWLYAFNIVNSGNRFVDTLGSSLYRMTEPIYRPIRRILPDLGGIDLSPLVVLVAIFFFEQLLAPYAYNPAYRLGY